MTVRTATGREFNCVSALIPTQGNAHLVLETSVVMAALIFANTEETATMTLIGEQGEEQTIRGYTHLDVLAIESADTVRVSIRPPRDGEEA